jgi:hypothetical protein
VSCVRITNVRWILTSDSSFDRDRVHERFSFVFILEHTATHRYVQSGIILVLAPATVGIVVRPIDTATLVLQPNRVRMSRLTIKEKRERERETYFGLDQVHGSGESRVLAVIVAQLVYHVQLDIGPSSLLKDDRQNADRQFGHEHQDNQDGVLQEEGARESSRNSSVWGGGESRARNTYD